MPAQHFDRSADGRFSSGHGHKGQRQGEGEGEAEHQKPFEVFAYPQSSCEDPRDNVTPPWLASVMTETIHTPEVQRLTSPGGLVILRVAVQNFVENCTERTQLHYPTNNVGHMSQRGTNPDAQVNTKDPSARSQGKRVLRGSAGHLNA